MKGAQHFIVYRIDCFLMHPCIVYLFPVISRPEPEKMATP